MKKYIEFDADGGLKARYDAAINTTIPASAVEVPESIFRQTINETDGIWKIDRQTGEIAKHPFPAPTLDRAKAAKLAEINRTADGLLNDAVSDYPSWEIQTFSQQTEEAKAYKTDSTAPTPLLSTLAAHRGIELSELVERVLTKHEAFSSTCILVIAQRQAMKDKLDKAAMVEDVQAIEVIIALPAVETETESELPA